jgi:hypothetical protein
MRSLPDHTAALRAHAHGLHSLEAGTELIITHASWLRRNDFTTAFIDTGPGPLPATYLAWLDWKGAISALTSGALPCSDSEASILRLAASIAAGIPMDLRHALTGLDERNARLVRHAVQHATGHR